MLGHVYAHTNASIPTFMESTPFFKKKIAAATPESTCNVFLQVAPPGINVGLGLSDGAEKLQQIFTQLLTYLNNSYLGPECVQPGPLPLTGRIYGCKELSVWGKEIAFPRLVTLFSRRFEGLRLEA